MFLQRLRPPRRILALFFVATALLCGTFGWLGWRLLEQDRALENQRLHERREYVADAAAVELARLLEGISSNTEPPGNGAVQAMFRPGRLEVAPAERLLFYPPVPHAPDPPPELFADAERMEFQKKDYEAALQALTRLTGQENLQRRAQVLLRMARVLRKSGQADASRKALEELSQLRGAVIDGAPAELLARYSIAESSGDPARVAREAAEIAAALDSGRYRLPRGVYLFYAQAVRHWLPQPGWKPPPERFALSAGVEELWEKWRQGPASTRGAGHVWVEDAPVFLFWRTTGEEMTGMAVTQTWLESRWHTSREGVRLALTDADGRALLGQPAGAQTVRLASATRLPWTVHARSAASGNMAEFALRRRFLLAGLFLILLLVGGAGYFMARAAARELALARLQSDFVASVSHEFRTPLTTLRQLSGLLQSGRVPDESRRRQYYDFLVLESDRLHRLVDDLIHFGRMEAGASEFRFEPFDPAGLVRSVVEDLQREVLPHGYTIELNANGGAPAVRGDRSAIGRALRNLLDNAVKYSPECRSVWVELAESQGQVAIRVRDRGLGIPASEQDVVFRKFVRGRAAKDSSIQGTGIGLATVGHIMSAHGGKVTLESAPGAGSTFTLWLPAMEES